MISYDHAFYVCDHVICQYTYVTCDHVAMHVFVFTWSYNVFLRVCSTLFVFCSARVYKFISNATSRTHHASHVHLYCIYYEIVGILSQVYHAAQLVRVA